MYLMYYLDEAGVRVYTMEVRDFADTYTRHYHDTAICIMPPAVVPTPPPPSLRRPRMGLLFAPTPLLDDRFPM